MNEFVIGMVAGVILFVLGVMFGIAVTKNFGE